MSMDTKERATVDEVLEQYDLTPEQTALAMAEIEERSRLAPFNSYHAYHFAHSVCARIGRGH